MDDPVRPARESDVPGLLLLYRSLNSFDPAYDAAAALVQWAEIRDRPGMTVLVLEAGEVLAATCVLVIVPNMTRSGRPWAVIENVATHPDHRRRGLGRRVLAAACDRAWAAGCYKVSLATGSAREETLRFYEGAGFTRGGKTHFEMRRA